ncbi:MAG: methionyl-tRNA formyltransferase [Prevotella sp.]|jgi:methionyl-tRNA formyltransferase
MDKKDLRIIFMGTPEFAVGTLSKLIENNYNVVAVVTQPDKPIGRHQNVLQPTAVKTYALQHDIPVLQPVKMKDPAFVEQLAAYKADIQVVVAFRMLPEVVWAMPRYGTFNVHAALLPQYRGAAPINWAIINGEVETGVTTFFLDKNIDTGRIILQKRFPIPEDANVEYVYDGLMALGADIAMETLDLVIAANGDIPSTDQAEWAGSSTPLHDAPKIFKETCRIDWNQPAKNIYNFIRGLSPYPVAWTTINYDSKKPTTLKLYSTDKTNNSCEGNAPGTIRTAKKRMYIACQDEWLEIFELQLAGRKRMVTSDFLNGNKDIETAILK